MITYRLGELSERTGLPPRTVRYYQAAGLLPKPGRDGKEAVYTENHVRRLQLISDMQNRGLKLETIRDVLASDVYTRESVADWLGLAQLRGPWSVELQRASFTEAELAEFVGPRLTEILDALVAEKYLIPRTNAAGEQVWEATDLPRLRTALGMHELGASIALCALAGQLIRRRITRLADDLVEMFVGAEGDGLSVAANREEAAARMERLRAIAWEAAGHIMAAEVEQSIHRHFDEQAG